MQLKKTKSNFVYCNNQIVLENLNTNFLGRKAFYYKKIDSTQSEIWRRLDETNIENGTLIYADIQTAGIGTHGRIWHTDEEKNIAFSFFMKMDCKIDNLNGLTKRIAEIIIEIFKVKYNIILEIKEPNDIYYKEKKLGGILTETKLISDSVKYLIVGIGINTNKQYFTADIIKKATSIKNEFGIEVETEKFISEFCNKFEVEILKRMGK